MKGIDWQFNCPHNSAEGGIWEHMIQCIKRVLQSTLKESANREHTLQSFLIEAENTVNSRLLTHLPLSHKDEELLTPNQFFSWLPKYNANSCECHRTRTHFNEEALDLVLICDPVEIGNEVR